MGAMASQIIILTIFYSAVYSGADQRKHQSSAPLAFDNDNDNENMFITTDIYSISETNARHKYIGKSIKQ